MNISHENASTYSLGCLLSQTYSRNIRSESVGFRDFVNLSKTESKRRKLLRKNKQIVFDILLKKKCLPRVSTYEMPVKDRISAAAFEKKSERERDELLSLFERLPANDDISKVLEFILNLEDSQVAPPREVLASLGDSIPEFGTRGRSYQEFPRSVFEVKLSEDTRRPSSTYKFFSPESFSLDLSYSSTGILTGRPSLGLDKPTEVPEAEEAHDEGYNSPSPGVCPLLDWEEVITSPASSRLTWETQGRRTSPPERPFLSEAGPESVHNVWRYGELIN